MKRSWPSLSRFRSAPGLAKYSPIVEKTFGDVYGHEKRITLALQGRWSQIAKADEQKVSPDDIGIDDDSNWFSADSRSRRFCASRQAI